MQEYFQTIAEKKQTMCKSTLPSSRSFDLASVFVLNFFIGAHSVCIVGERDFTQMVFAQVHPVLWLYPGLPSPFFWLPLLLIPFCMIASLLPVCSMGVCVCVLYMWICNFIKSKFRMWEETSDLCLFWSPAASVFLERTPCHFPPWSWPLIRRNALSFSVDTERTGNRRPQCPQLPLNNCRDWFKRYLVFSFLSFSPFLLRRSSCGNFHPTIEWSLTQKNPWSSALKMGELRLITGP